MSARRNKPALTASGAEAARPVDSEPWGVAQAATERGRRLAAVLATLLQPGITFDAGMLDELEAFVAARVAAHAGGDGARGPAPTDPPPLAPAESSRIAAANAEWSESRHGLAYAVGAAYGDAITSLEELDWLLSSIAHAASEDGEWAGALTRIGGEFITHKLAGWRVEEASASARAERLYDAHAAQRAAG